MQDEDRGVCEDGSHGAEQAEGALASPLRLTRGMDDGGPDGTVEDVQTGPDPEQGAVVPGDDRPELGGRFGFLGSTAGSGSDGEQAVDKGVSIPVELLVDESKSIAVERASTGGQVMDDCVSTVKAFVRGGRGGLDQLKRVLPNIFKTFPECDPEQVLLDSGLEPSFDGAQFPTFYFSPTKEGVHMIRQSSQGKRQVKRQEPPAMSSQALFDVESTDKRPRVRSDELEDAYSSAKSGWGE